MSSYHRMTKHPITNEWENAFWVDDLFGHYNYGVAFPSDQEKHPEAMLKDIAFDVRNIKLETKEWE